MIYYSRGKCDSDYIFLEGGLKCQSGIIYLIYLRLSLLKEAYSAGNYVYLSPCLHVVCEVCKWFRYAWLRLSLCIRFFVRSEITSYMDGVV
jgi:hypothetical protein